MQHLVYLEAQSSRRPGDVIRMNAARDLARSYAVVQDFRKAGQIATAAIYAAIDDDSREKEFSDAFKDSGLLCKDEENIDWSKLDKFFESREAFSDLRVIQDAVISAMDLDSPGKTEKMLVEAGKIKKRKERVIVSSR